ncbi:tRNA (5-methylaminomethyl-2-thiouridine)(34)-methyltransferase MnmD [Mucilaginibacter daejeonensis]|uniref:tRNA (5-methylaminomethyl-2-thiouridine)(34)-methyltransferase MnmD n=1 Tax=Mucilaginibacter daejeonensis TaxID=398049 RepID=UPI001D17CE61|nr:tRNA (5-methylaminomethyl-2-thiouridine)(34)-methyltransferase MnmD [Mucilaginibacter daejeonensis]UEG52092.1 tRNA (5-methylaminomethyl-2-thiouridine)(34)-methyltransferase MnmD [Mucilaginibacter daejeonensis]
MSNLSIVTTADGSRTIFNAEVGENYHSKHGALQESRHVFLQQGLDYFLTNNGQPGQLSVLEVGFGTGLNFLLTADHCTQNNIKLNYTGIEAYPLTTDLLSATGYQEHVPEAIWNSFLYSYPDALLGEVELNDTIDLQIAHTQLLTYTADSTFNVIYFDAFAAIHQPEMWDEEAIAHTIKFLAPGGVFVTYAITGNLKRQLKALGLTVQKAPGAPGKREMLRAISPV